MAGTSSLTSAEVPAATLATAADATLAADADAGGRRRRLASIAEYVVVSVFTLVVSWPFLRPGRYVTGFDTVAYSGPNLRITLDAWRHGRLALWNDLIFGGVTHLGNPQAGALYPLRVLAVPFGISRGIAVLVVVHLLILANGVVALVSWRLRLRPPAATVAAVTVVGSGLIMQKSLQLEQLLVLAWLPLLLTVVHWTVTAARPLLPAAATAVVTALVLTAGHPQMVYTLAPLAVAVAVAFAAGERAWRRLGVVALAGVAGALLAAPQLLPALAATRDGALSGARSLDVLRDPAYHLDPGHTLRALLGNPLATKPDADSGTYEALSFVGVAAAALAVVGLVDGLRRRERRVLAGVLGAAAVLGTLAAYGPRTSLYRLAYDHVPLFDQARVPARWLAITVIAAGILAGLGTDAVVARRVDRRALAVVGGVVVAVGLLVVTGAVTTPGRRTIALWVVAGGAVLAAAFLPRARRSALTAAVVALPALAVMVELGMASRHAVAARGATAASIESYGGDVVRFLDGQPGRSVALTFDNFGSPAYLVAALRPNANALFDIPSLDGYDGGVQVTRRWATATASLADGPFAPDFTLRSQIALPVDTALLARFGVRWIVLDTTGTAPPAAVPDWRGPLATDGGLQVFENPAWQGEAVAWFTSQRATDSAAAARLLASGTVAPNGTVVEDDSPALTCAGACPSVGLTVERSRPERATVTADLRRDAIVTLDEQHDGGWSATVDGRGAPTVAVDGLVVGVRVPAGQHVIRFAYEPEGFRAGLWLAAVGAILLVLALARSAQERRAVARATTGPSRLTPTRSPSGE